MQPAAAAILGQQIAMAWWLYVCGGAQWQEGRVRGSVGGRAAVV